MRASSPTVSSSKKLLQTLVDEPTFRKFKKLAKAAGNTRAGYLRHLVQTHVLRCDDPHSLANQINSIILAKKRAGLKKDRRVDNAENFK
jgi:hypothetical protein